MSAFAEEAGLDRQNIFMLDFQTDGTVWIAASNGLVRYDGYRWRRFTTDDGLPSNFVRTVCVTRNGELWVGTDRGAVAYDGKGFSRRGSEAGLAGPCVRRIIEDPDGTLWFCSDRWPEPPLSSGLTSLRDGRWTVYTSHDGLPSDSVLNYFRDSAGRQFVMTTAGIAQRFGERWDKPQGGAELAGTVCTEMTESPRLGILARSTERSFARIGNVWRQITIPGNVVGDTPQAVTTTRAGDIITSDFDGKRSGLYRWTGDRLELITPLVEHYDPTIQVVREAPDGALWVATYGILTRWQTQGGEWSEYADMPLPRARDQQGWVWFQDNKHESIYRAKTGKLEKLDGLRGNVSAGVDGQVWLWGADDVITRFSGETTRYPVAETGLRRVRAHILDGKGFSWFDGTDAQGEPAAAFFDGTRWTRVPLPGLAQHVIVEITPDPLSGIWLLTRNPDGVNLSCVHLDGTTTSTIPARYPGLDTFLHLTVDQRQTLWLSGQAGAYRYDLKTGGNWQRVLEIPGHDVGRGLVRDNEMWIPCSAWTGGESGFSVYRNGKWSFFSGGESELLVSAADGTLYVGTEAGIHAIPPGPGALPSKLTFPANRKAITLVQGGSGDLWIGVESYHLGPASVLHYQVDGALPESRITGPAEVRSDRTLSLSVETSERFVSANNVRSYQYSWRFDQGEWTHFGPLPAGGFPVAALSPGEHRFDLRARDEGLEVEKKPVSHSFIVQSIPLQERSWFRPAVIAVFFTIVGLGAFAMERARRFARANRLLQQAREGLEERVEERTAELSQSNRALETEVTERKRAQAELETTQGRLLDISRRAGMAEVATSVLHNVGNVLNSVNVSTDVVIDRLRGSKVHALERLKELLTEQAGGDLTHFLTNDARAKLLPEFITSIVSSLKAERTSVLTELEQLRKHVEHIKHIVAMQQSHAKVSGAAETIPAVELIEDALRINAATLVRTKIQVTRDYLTEPLITIDRHKVLQILVNLVRNAQQACEASSWPEKHVTIRLMGDDEQITIAVIDNGEGIAPENLTKIFQQGFTTKREGHGFGLHSGALAARELEGELTAASAGPGCGATFSLRVPLKPKSHRPPATTTRAGFTRAALPKSELSNSR